jgi:hypothetical protein
MPVKILMLAFLITVVGGVSLVSAADADADEEIPGFITSDSINLSLPQPTDYSLSSSEIADLLFMREEEQMAHDLYMVWSGMYSRPIFGNIAQAEQTHVNSVQLLIDRYNLSSEMSGNLSSGYHNPDIQALSETLLAQGNVSLTDALKAGVMIEEVDISDLNKAIANTTRADIIFVYTNLRKGSESHLKAFNSQLS